ncbi:metallopeptidase [Aquipluma nitroreducens]|uniref:Metallopeptidase n=1 Tax=Aquipluma nitroreducens TaxID=2010828 RepID=A0A5K7S5R0_9BACT|nr:M13 family metallopeptidase [Aquipluma nitroreducens]BBE16888.1 metallopeptidase [Aquipluma nitroreducens]
MGNLNRFVLISLLMGSLSCRQEPPKLKAIDLADMDKSYSPATDFDNYSNGGWKKRFPIPDEKSRFGSFDLLADSGEVQVQKLITGIASSKQTAGSIASKIADFYNTGMDTAKIETDGLAPVQPLFNEISAIQNKDDVMKVVADLHTQGIRPMYSLFSDADQKNSEMVVAYLYQGGLGMPDRDYYMKDDERSKSIQEAYKIHLQKIFVLAGDNEANSKLNSSIVYKLEYRLAKSSMTLLEQRDPHKIYHKMNLEGLRKISPEIDWSVQFQNLGLKNPGDFIVGQPDFVAELGKMLNEVSVDDWKIYLKWQVLRSTASYLPLAFVNQSFDFFGKTLSGQMAQRPRWKRVQESTNGALSEALGQLYVQKYFPAESKKRMIELVNNLRVSLGERIQKLAWMSNETKAKALDKLAAITVKVGYPDKWRDYSSLEVSTDSYCANVLRARQFDFNYMISKVNKPVDRTEWMMAPQEVNAYYNPSMNEIVFPAAILQPPFFYVDGDDAVNYGAIGVVIGHEMTHGFDDQGCQYDKVGNLNNWWTDEDSKLFKERTSVLVNQFSGFTVLDTLKANGELSLGENIADLGGLNVAYIALHKVLTGNENPIDGFTPDQRFFLAYAHLWAQNIRDKEIVRRTKEDPHSLGRFRILGPLRNMPEFHKAFDVKEGDYMYLKEADRAVIW